MHEIREAIDFARKIGVDAIRIASARVYTGTDVIKPTKNSYEVSKEYLPEPGSRFSHYASDLKRVGSKKICDWLWKRMVINPDDLYHPVVRTILKSTTSETYRMKASKAFTTTISTYRREKSQRTLRLDLGYERKIFPVLYVYHWATS